VLRRTLICLVLTLLVAGPASAGQIVVKLGLTPGKLQSTAVRTGTRTVVVTVADGRGNGAGWTLRASDPVVVTGISARCASSSTCTLPRVVESPQGKVVLHVARDSGMGVMQLEITLQNGVSAATKFLVT
jgi:hypothetical protein